MAFSCSSKWQIHTNPVKPTLVLIQSVLRFHPSDSAYLLLGQLLEDVLHRLPRFRDTCPFSALSSNKRLGGHLKGWFMCETQNCFLKMTLTPTNKWCPPKIDRMNFRHSYKYRKQIFRQWKFRKKVYECDPDIIIMLSVQELSFRRTAFILLGGRNPPTMFSYFRLWIKCEIVIC